MSNSRRRPQVIATIALCAVVAALAVAVIGQQLAAARLSGDIETQKQLLSKSRLDLKDRAKYRSEYGDLSLKLGGRMSTCSWSDQMPYMVAQVTGIVESNGLKVANLQPEPMTSSGSIQRFPMRIGFETDLKHVTEVLRDLKGSVPLTDIERLDIRNSQSGNGKLQINMTVASFVVLDKNSPVTRRRAVVPAKKDASEPNKSKSESEKPAAKSEAKQPDKPAPKPAAKPPVVKAVERSPQRPDGSERRRPEGTELSRTARPTNGNANRPAGAEVRGGEKAMQAVPDGKSQPKRSEAGPEGGAR